MKKANVVTGIIFLALSIFAYVESLGMTSMLMTDSLGPSFWPKCLSVVMGSLSIVLILQGLFSKKETRSSPFAFKTVGFKRMVLVSLTLIATGAIIYFLGIYIGILFMLPVCMFSIWLSLKAALTVGLIFGSAAFLFILFCVFVWLSFDVALRVPLPMGTLFS